MLAQRHTVTAYSIIVKFRNTCAFSQILCVENCLLWTSGSPHMGYPQFGEYPFLLLLFD